MAPHDENPPSAQPVRRTVLVNGRGSLLHRIRIAQTQSANAEAQTQPGKVGKPRPRKPSMPKLPWSNDQ